MIVEFKKIGITSKSKRMYDCSENKFKRSDNTEAWFCSYHDKTKGLTYYFRNHEYVDFTLDSLFATANQEQQSTKIENPDLCKLGIPISVDWESQSTEIVNPNLHLITSETTTKTSTKTDDRQTNTYSPCVNRKNDAKIGQSVALDISNLNWPIALEQNQIVMTALAKLPDDQARQKVLDVVAKKLDNGELQKPVSFIEESG